MVRALLTTVLLSVIYLCIGQSRWEQVYGLYNKDEQIRDVVECYDHGCFTISGQVQDESGWGIKTDINGNVLWEKYIGGGSFVFSPWSVLHDHGSLVIVGVYRNENLSNSGIIIKLDSCGEKQWCNVYTTDLFLTTWFYDAVLLDNSDMLVLAKLKSYDQIKQIFLFYFNRHGELLWTKPFATKDDYQQIGAARCTDIIAVDNGFILSGWCYWLYPGGTYLYLQPLIIKVDSLFNEEWILPYGANDSILGEAYGTIQLSSNEFMSYGFAYHWDSAGTPSDQAWLMRYDTEGSETVSTIIPNNAIEPPTRANIIYDAVKLNDTTFIAASYFGPEYNEENPRGEYLFDLNGNISNPKSHEGTTIKTMVRETSDGNYLFGTGIRIDDNYDIMLYKLNDSLESVPYDTNQYTYDSLCPYLIQSDTISLEDCMLIVNIDDIPGPEEYYARQRTIPIKAYPNPASDKIFFELENTQYHSNIKLYCYNIFGRLIIEQKILTGQFEAKTEVTSLRKGMYVAVVRANGKILGRCKFVVN